MDSELEHVKSRLKDVYRYCQIDSIQQARLEAKLGLVLQNVQISNITKCPLISCVQQAVTRKVECIINQTYHDYNMLHCDVANNFYQFFYNPSFKELKELNLKNVFQAAPDTDDSEEEDEIKTDTKKDAMSFIRNTGGFVNLDQKGYHQYITAVDIASSYPAAKESNNIDKSCLVKAENLEYILLHPDEFEIKRIESFQVKDMYAPYKEEELTIDFEDYKPENVQKIKDLGYIKSQKSYRWRFILTNTKNEQFVLDQFFFLKTNMQVKYPFVFLRQGLRSENPNLPVLNINTQTPLTFSPKAHLLLDFRKRRELAKKQAKDKSLTQDQRNFYDAKQQAIKLLINSEYGANDAKYCTAYNMFESSLVTKQARYAIQNCRDLLGAEVWKIHSPQTFDFSLMDKYNAFIQKYIIDFDPLFLKKEEINGNVYITNVKVDLVYTDTDSSYVSLHDLDSRHVVDENMRHYILTTAQGLYNNFFQYFIKEAMHKLSLKFGFEHALCSAWHITRKNYLGQEVPNITCEEKDGKLVPLCEISDKQDFSDYDPSKDLFEQYKEKKHLKITGLKIIKRNITPFGIIAYLAVMEQALNTKGQLQIFDVLKQLKDNFYNMPLKNVLERKKITQAVISTHPNMNFGLGETVYFYYRQPFEFTQNRYYLGSYKKDDLAVFLTSEEKEQKETTLIKDIEGSVFMAQYVYNVACNLLKFQNNDILEREIKEAIKENDLLLLGAPKRVKNCKPLTKQFIKQLMKTMDENNLSSLEVDGNYYQYYDLETELQIREQQKRF